MPLQRIDTITSKYVLQYTFSALASGVCVPIIDAIGVGLQCTISESAHIIRSAWRNGLTRFQASSWYTLPEASASL